MMPTAMFDDDGFLRAVDVLRVGRLTTLIEVSYGLDYMHRRVFNRKLDPQPCGMCRGSGKLLLMTCKFCDGRGHSPNKNESVERVVRAAEAGFEAGVNAGTALADAKTEKSKRDVIDVNYFDEPEEAHNPETFSTYDACAECSRSPCDCSKK